MRSLRSAPYRGNRGLSRAGRRRAPLPVAWGIVLAAGLVGFGGACSPERGASVGWKVGFACAADATRTDKVLLTITKGDCRSATPPVYQAAVVRAGGAASAPDELPPGVYAFRATALDPADTLVAQTCVAVTLPSSQTVDLMLAGDQTCESGSAISNWSSSHPVDGGVSTDTVSDDDASVKGSPEEPGSAMLTRDASRLTLAHTEFPQGKPVVVGFADVTKAGMPFVGLYTADGQPLATHKVKFGRKENLVSGSHEFAALAVGQYLVRLVYDTDLVVDETEILVAEDRDGDGTIDSSDGCPSDPAKLAPEQCGCDASESDGDGDGVADCLDLCAMDNSKVAPGACGCGVSDADQDGDGTRDCIDACPNDRNKVAAGLCGCGIADTDTDGDTVLDCFDGCPLDPAKLEPLACGCGQIDSDLNTDGDSALDCNDGCISDPNKTSAGTCGCGHIEPFDTAGYRDAQGFSCADWQPYDCTEAAEKWKYTTAEETSILQNCSASCGVCPP